MKLQTVHSKVAFVVGAGLCTGIAAFSCSNPPVPAIPYSAPSGESSGDGDLLPTGCGSSTATATGENKDENSSLLDNGTATSTSSGTGSGPTYYGDIAPILKSSCTLAGCHAAGAQAPTPDLTTYQLVLNNKVDLIADVTGTPPTMPQGGKLTADQIALFTAWQNANFAEGTPTAGGSDSGTTTSETSGSSTSTSASKSSSSSSSNPCKAKKSTATRTSESSGSGTSESSGSESGTGTSSKSATGSATGTAKGGASLY